MWSTFSTVLGVIQTKPMGHSPTKIVSSYQEALVSELSRNLNLIKSHGMKGIAAVVVAVSRL
ncbi:hypothetical protein [Acidicapsa acidisoli]|uniref:hypothetical protein n=1 Tax=Acidicapsa acidisoli TaxID=1615681 RepID=UPI0021E0C82B|nr:hypothetical protein [Acidicapsa acidisoli]